MDGLSQELGGGRTALAGVVFVHALLLALLWWVTPQETLVPLLRPFSARLVEDHPPESTPPTPPSTPPRAASPRVAPPPRAPILAARPADPAVAPGFVVPAQPAEPTAAPGTGAPTPGLSPAPAPTPAPEPLVGARFDADYLDNPKPLYPGASRRLKEEGKVLLRVYVSAAGLPEKVEVREGSGFLRLDEAARETVQRWRFVPARRGSEAVAAWVLVPISFTLQS